MTHEIARICDDIVGQLTRIGSPIAQFLRPGLSEKQIKDVERTLPFAFPNSIAEMYKWRNGTELVEKTSFFPWWQFDTIEESAGRYEVLCAPRNELWNDHWFPIFSASDISSIGICCDNVAVEDGRIVRYEYTIGTGMEFGSLEAMLQTILEGYQSGAIFMGTDGTIDIEDVEFAEIAKKHNPEIKCWEERSRL
jgi:hypothetical protein